MHLIYSIYIIYILEYIQIPTPGLCTDDKDVVPNNYSTNNYLEDDCRRDCTGDEYCYAYGTYIYSFILV